MKMTKSLCLAFAGLGLFACSNEEVVTENGGGAEGATVTVKFVGDGLTRALETSITGGNGTTIPIQVKTGTIRLTAQAVGGSNVQQIGETLSGNKDYVFTGVRVPESIEVVINDGKAESLTLAEVAKTGLAEPLYGKETKFIQDAEGNYTVTIDLDRQVARLQFSGLDFVTDGSSYTKLTLDGVYLNGAIKMEGGSDKYLADSGNVWQTVSTSWSETAPVFDAINAVVIGDDAVEGSWPADEKCYAYNVFPATGTENLPKLTVCFSGAEQTGVTAATDKRYARVAKYKIEGEKGDLQGVGENGEITSFVAGYIYNITGLQLEDKDLGPTPEGGDDVTLTATVKVIPWTVVNGTVDWN